MNPVKLTVWKNLTSQLRTENNSAILRLDQIIADYHDQIDDELFAIIQMLSGIKSRPIDPFKSLYTLVLRIRGMQEQTGELILLDIAQPKLHPCTQELVSELNHEDCTQAARIMRSALWLQGYQQSNPSQTIRPNVEEAIGHLTTLIDNAQQLKKHPSLARLTDADHIETTEAHTTQDNDQFFDIPALQASRLLSRVERGDNRDLQNLSSIFHNVMFISSSHRAVEIIAGIINNLIINNALKVASATAEVDAAIKARRTKTKQRGTSTKDSSIETATTDLQLKLHLQSNLVLMMHKALCEFIELDKTSAPLIALLLQYHPDQAVKTNIKNVFYSMWRVSLTIAQLGSSKSLESASLYQKMNLLNTSHNFDTYSAEQNDEIMDMCIYMGMALGVYNPRYDLSHFRNKMHCATQLTDRQMASLTAMHADLNQHIDDDISTLIAAEDEKRRQQQIEVDRLANLKQQQEQQQKRAEEKLESEKPNRGKDPSHEEPSHHKGTDDASSDRQQRKQHSPKDIDSIGALKGLLQILDTCDEDGALSLIEQHRKNATVCLGRWLNGGQSMFHCKRLQEAILLLKTSPQSGTAAISEESWAALLLKHRLSNKLFQSMKPRRWIHAGEARQRFNRHALEAITHDDNGILALIVTLIKKHSADSCIGQFIGYLLDQALFLPTDLYALRRDLLLHYGIAQSQSKKQDHDSKIEQQKVSANQVFSSLPSDLMAWRHPSVRTEVASTHSTPQHKAVHRDLLRNLARQQRHRTETTTSLPNLGIDEKTQRAIGDVRASELLAEFITLLTAGDAPSVSIGLKSSHALFPGLPHVDVDISLFAHANETEDSAISKLIAHIYQRLAATDFIIIDKGSLVGAASTEPTHDLQIQYQGTPLIDITVGQVQSGESLNDAIRRYCAPTTNRHNAVRLLFTTDKPATDWNQQPILLCDEAACLDQTRYRCSESFITQQRKLIVSLPIDEALEGTTVTTLRNIASNSLLVLKELLRMGSCTQPRPVDESIYRFLSITDTILQDKVYGTDFIAILSQSFELSLATRTISESADEYIIKIAADFNRSACSSQYNSIVNHFSAYVHDACASYKHQP